MLKFNTAINLMNNYLTLLDSQYHKVISENFIQVLKDDSYPSSFINHVLHLKRQMKNVIFP